MRVTACTAASGWAKLAIAASLIVLTIVPPSAAMIRRKIAKRRLHEDRKAAISPMRSPRAVEPLRSVNSSVVPLTSRPPAGILRRGTARERSAT